jgi:hypothetical protein
LTSFSLLIEQFGLRKEGQSGRKKIKEKRGQLIEGMRKSRIKNKNQLTLVTMMLSSEEEEIRCSSSLVIWEHILISLHYV